MVRVWKNASLLPLCLLLAQAYAALLAVDYGQQFLKAMVVSPQAPLEMVLTPEAKRKEVSGMGFKRLSDRELDVERLYGAAVGALTTRAPQDTALHLKSLLGRTLDDPEVALYQLAHPGLKLSATARKSIALEIDGTAYPVEELVGMNLQEIAARANRHIRENDRRSRDAVEKVALATPAFFDQYQRLALMDAGMFVNDINGLTLINDGLAIAVNYALKRADFAPDLPHNYIIYDMGSGSTKATLVTITQHSDSDVPVRIEMQGYGFNSTLGGSGFTLKIADIVKHKFLAKNTAVSEDALAADPRAIAKIIQAAEKAKLVLSANADASVSIEALTADIDFRATVTREEFEAAIAEDVTAMTGPIWDAVNKQFTSEDQPRITIDSLTGVILAGGSSRVPFVQQAIADIIGPDRLLKTVNADEAVVNGATLRGVQLFELFKTRPFNVTDRSVFNFTIRSQDKDQDDVRIFKAGDSFPQKKSMLYPVKDASKKSKLAIYENDRLIKTIKIKGISNFTKELCPFGAVHNMTFALTQLRTLNFDTIQTYCIKDASEAAAVNREILGESFIDELDEDEEFEEFDSDETAVFAFDEEARKADGTMINPKARGFDDYVQHMDSNERMECTNRIQQLDANDKKRFQLQEAKNHLESSLYDARNFLAEEDVIASGPKSQIDRLSKVVSEYLEWLDEEADAATKSEINKRKKQVTQMKANIEEYMETANEPLGLEQFQGMLTKAEDLLKKIEGNPEQLEQKLVEFEGKVNEEIMDVRDEFLKIKTPSYLAKTIENYEPTIQFFNESFVNMTRFVEQKIYDTMDREQLYQVKAMFEKLEETTKEKFAAMEAIQSQHMSDLKSTYQRKIRALKRKEQKKKSSSAAESADATASSKPLSASKSAEESAIHDEL
ncbi:Hsp70 family chaperone [Maudiozyma humilis]|uniref:Hsp70 family chaperone n=1 Tax=Maudiozyma humilis TaxID=51915 RepID=A0AAV5RPP2_MAUHU|nr:Hsp70 family chaperone [Kazachstania humilis]